MFFELNQSKKFQISELSCAFLNGFVWALLITALLYGITDLLLLELLPSIDFLLSPLYYLIFVCIFLAIIAYCLARFHKAKRGVELTEDKLIFCVGYTAKGLPLDFPRLYGTIKFDDIIDVDYMEYFKWSELRKDYKNYNCNWHFIGASSGNYSVARVKTNPHGIENYYLLPLDDIEGFIENINRHR